MSSKPQYFQEIQIPNNIERMKNSTAFEIKFSVFIIQWFIIQLGESEGVEPTQVGTKYRFSHSDNSGVLAQI